MRFSTEYGTWLLIIPSLIVFFGWAIARHAGGWRGKASLAYFVIAITGIVAADWLWGLYWLQKPTGVLKLIHGTGMVLMYLGEAIKTEGFHFLMPLVGMIVYGIIKIRHAVLRIKVIRKKLYMFDQDKYDSWGNRIKNDSTENEQDVVISNELFHTNIPITRVGKKKGIPSYYTGVLDRISLILDQTIKKRSKQ